MTGFWIAAAALVALAWALLWPAVRRTPAAAAPSPPTAAAEAALDTDPLRLLKEQIATLDAELAAGSIDAAQHHAARLEIERRVLEENQPAAPPRARAGASPRGALVVIGLGVPLLAFGLYLALGNFAAVAPVVETAAEPEISPEAVDAMLAQMEKTLTARPAQADDLRGWTLLARSYASLRRFPQARRAYDRAIGLAPNDAQLLADQADVIAMLQEQRTDGEPARLIERALQIDPRNLKALALAGSAAFEHRDFATAIKRWSEARALAPEGSEFAAGLDRSLKTARAEETPAVPNAAGAVGGGTAVAAASPPADRSVPSAEGVKVPPEGAASATPADAKPATAAAATSTRLSGRVQLAPALAARVAPGDTVFIYARAAEGPRMPLAILRRDASAWPIAFELDDSLAMSPEMKLSKFGRVVVTARVSRSGAAMPAAGDLQGQSGVVAPGSSGIDVTISDVQP